jgi:hypothetical protein
MDHIFPLWIAYYMQHHFILLMILHWQCTQHHMPTWKEKLESLCVNGDSWVDNEIYVWKNQYKAMGIESYVMGLTSLIICFSLVGLNEMSFLCGQFKARWNWKLRTMVESFVTIKKKLLPNNIDNHPST